MATTAAAATRSSKRRDPEATRAAILDAAEELFLTRGPADTPTSAVARKAGVTKSLIHHHFGSKEDLWSEVKRRHFGKYYEVQKEMLASSLGTAELLRESIVTYFRFLQDDPRSVRFASWRFIEEDDPCHDQEVDLFDLGVRKVRKAQEAGELRGDVEPISVIKAFLALVDHWFQSRPLLCQMLGPEADLDELEEKYLRDIVCIFLEGVRPPS
jgi:TetR/AcrR family transcriptional regulator